MSSQTERIARARLAINEAAQISNPDNAIAMLMEKAEISSGDVAGQFFSEFDDLQAYWTSISIEKRATLLSDYLDTEAIYQS
ncbi:hypothetical protein RYZ18_02385 [Roseovarius sp. 10]|jgi:hypothetical protein|uniref:hypothetical protein n=1 Tax=Roseovarius sp. 10 TaxID=3080563 RepID=UPI0019ECD0FC|nr:hypothetical protein [Roseovarius sp. 10]MBE1295490.1 hypothetical protein [Paracoccaceae bacterium]MDV7200168.1 hypothetical protein [Roseovarius sp. 10]